MTDPDAWKKNVADIVSQKNQATDDAAKREQSRKDHLIAENQKAREILRDQPEEAFREFASYLESQGETVTVRHNWEDANGPWIGVDVSDRRGFGSMSMVGIVALRGRRRSRAVMPSSLSSM